MIDITRHEELIVRQQVEGLEAITGFETRNRYEVLTPDGQQVMYAYEESGGLSRFFLKTHRPLDIHVVDTDGNPVLTASRQFFWFFSHLLMSDDSGRHVARADHALGDPVTRARASRTSSATSRSSSSEIALCSASRAWPRRLSDRAPRRRVTAPELQRLARRLASNLRAPRRV